MFDLSRTSFPHTSALLEACRGVDGPRSRGQNHLPTPAYQNHGVMTIEGLKGPLLFFIPTGIPTYNK